MSGSVWRKDVEALLLAGAAAGEDQRLSTKAAIRTAALRAKGAIVTRKVDGIGVT